MTKKKKELAVVDAGRKLLDFFREEQRNRGRVGCTCAECQDDMIKAVRKFVKEFSIVDK